MTTAYFAPSVRDLNMASDEGFLTGSVTVQPITADDVTVNEYINGFEDDEFKDISFD